jgi:hypothetical protein
MSPTNHSASARPQPALQLCQGRMGGHNILAIGVKSKNKIPYGKKILQ